MKNPAAYRSLLRRLAGNGLCLAPDEDAMKRLPRGFESVIDPPLAEAVRRRTFIVREALTLQDVASPELVDRLLDFAQRARPLLTFGWKALGLLPGTGG